MSHVSPTKSRKHLRQRVDLALLHLPGRRPERIIFAATACCSCSCSIRHGADDTVQLRRARRCVQALLAQRRLLMRPLVDRVEFVDAVELRLLALRCAALARGRLSEADILRVRMHLARKLVEFPWSSSDNYKEQSESRQQCIRRIKEKEKKDSRLTLGGNCPGVS